jgi:hypothetical protein
MKLWTVILLLWLSGCVKKLPPPDIEAFNKYWYNELMKEAKELKADQPQEAK